MIRRQLALVAVAMAIALAPAAHANEPAPFPEFTFKRVKPPEAGAARRITVQITAPPILIRPPAIEDEPPEARPRTPGAYGWYWDLVSPSLNRASPGRLDEAVLALREAPSGKEVRSPRLDDLRRIADRHGIEILSATVGTKVSPALALAVISVESAGRANAVSRVGAQGLMQLMPATAARFGVSDSFRSSENIRGGVAYLDFLLREFTFDPVLALAAYNAGEGAVRENGGVPPYDETRAYVPKVLSAWNVARGLCMTPPELVTDGCVFVRGRGS